MSTSGLVAYFESEDSVLSAILDARKAGYPIEDVYAPYAIHGINEAMALRPSRLTYVCFLAGVTGCLSALALEIYTSAVSWPLNVGGKPFDSFPAFIPVAFELTILVGALTTVTAFFLRSKLFPGAAGHTYPRVTDDQFALVLAKSPELDLTRATELVRRHGAVRIEAEGA